MTELKPRDFVLPPSLPPRGLSRVVAAAYIGVSVTLFDRMIENGLMPKPKRIWGRVVWDRLALDNAFAAIPNGDDKADRNFWDEVA